MSPIHVLSADTGTNRGEGVRARQVALVVSNLEWLDLKPLSDRDSYRKRLLGTLSFLRLAVGTYAYAILRFVIGQRNYSEGKHHGPIVVWILFDLFLVMLGLSMFLSGPALCPGRFRSETAAR